MELHLTNIKFPNKSGLVRLRLAVRISVAVLNEHSMLPEEAATLRLSLVTRLRRGH